ncbi:hypothetical protein [Bosea sp. ASV33]|uniref:hypothetical protein n=1 Tax=Bosea sp. ASV33 TaxID=2795106 RepID=UPI0018EDF16B|nr:hypothetical protein [Bosea sp. ASV33]
MDLNIHRAEQFDRWISDALAGLRRLQDFRTDFVRASVLRTVQSCVKVALSYANSLNCADRRNLCLKVLSWIRTDLNRLTERSAA